MAGVKGQRKHKWHPELVDLVHRRPELIGVGIATMGREFTA